MAESNAEWGDLVVHDSEMAEVWDGFHRLPDLGENPALDALCERKGITLASLVRLGAKLTEPGGTVLAFGFDGGIKYRDTVTGARWTYIGSDFSRLKIIPSSTSNEDQNVIIVAEGETDAARLTLLYPEANVAIMGGGARYVTETMVDQLAEYEMVLIGLDTDEAGEAGSAKLGEKLLNAARFAPPDNDWCSSAEENCPVIPTELERPPEPELLVRAGELLNYEMPEVISYFEQAILPIGGSMILHGWVKSFKSFMAMDIAAALAQGDPWCHFEPTEEPVRVASMQYEIPPPFYQQRVQQLRASAKHPDLFDENFLVWTPLQRPRFRAGDTKQEDLVLRTLVEQGVQVFVLDPVRRAMGTLGTKDGDEVRKLLGFFERIQDEGIAVVAVHHDNKDSARSRGGDPVGMTGAGDWAGDFDTIVSVSLPRGTKLQEPQRNLTFTLRNAPSIGDRGMEIDEQGHITYSTESHGEWEDDGETTSLPPI